MQEGGNSLRETVEAQQLADIAAVRPRQRVQAVDARRAALRLNVG